MNLPDALRYTIWGAVAATADANRREYHMQTTWLPHLATNTLTLLLPDVIRVLIPKDKTPSNLMGQLLVQMVRDNDHYVVYVTPLALGYILSHPKYNIFKGDLAEIQLLGLRLDAIPHSATGFALTAAVCDTLATASQMRTRTDSFSRLMPLVGRYPALTSLSILAALTFVWELGEYRVHQHEMALRGDISKINMMWSMSDTVRDVAANLLGWAGALLVRYRRQSNGKR
jgi:hypothetical protein